MPGVPIFHLHTRPSSPKPLPLPLLEDPLPAQLLDTTIPIPTLKKKKSILKKMAFPITWGEEQPVQHHHNKLHKPSQGKNVHFTPPPSSHPDQATIATSTAHPDGLFFDPDTGLITPNATPVPNEKKAKKGGLLSGILPKGSKNTSSVLPPTPPHSAQPPAAHFETDQNGEGGYDPWHHHASYFPEYEPIHAAPSSIAGMPGVVNHSTYFPDYTPVFHASHPIHAYPGASGALAYALSSREAEAAAHAQRVGHSIAVHYPDLSRFAEYQQQGGKGVSAAWQSNKWGVEGWTGYGWTGEKLPMEDGTTFGAPMPKGVPIPVEKEGGGKNKKKKGKGGDGGEGGDGEGEEGGDDDAEEEKEGEPAAEGEAPAAQPAAGGGVGGGGGKNKKKKKK